MLSVVYKYLSFIWYSHETVPYWRVLIVSSLKGTPKAHGLTVFVDRNDVASVHEAIGIDGLRSFVGLIPVAWEQRAHHGKERTDVSCHIIWYATSAQELLLDSPLMRQPTRFLMRSSIARFMRKNVRHSEREVFCKRLSIPKLDSTRSEQLKSPQSDLIVSSRQGIGVKNYCLMQWSVFTSYENLSEARRESNSARPARP